jgi:hypothetical protein
MIRGGSPLYIEESLKCLLACPCPLGQASETGRYEALLLVRRNSFSYGLLE